MDELDKLRKEKIKLKQEVEDHKELNKIKKEISSLKKEKVIEKNPVLGKLKSIFSKTNDYLLKQQKRFQ